jgi:hypothetical protein
VLLDIDAADHSDSALSADRIQVLVGDSFSMPLMPSRDETPTASTVSVSYRGSRTTSTKPTSDQGADRQRPRALR